MEMKALTLTQPWATLIAVGSKRIETRSWGTNHRGRIAIHAAKGLAPVGGKRGLYELCREEPFCSAISEAPFSTREEGFDSARELPFGAVVATARLADVKRIDMALRAQVLSQTLTPHEIEFGDYSSGRYAWILEDVVALSMPVECKGALSLWDVPTDVMSKIALNGGF